MLEVEPVTRRLVGWQERVGLGGFGHVNRLVGVREREPVEVHHHGVATAGFSATAYAMSARSSASWLFGVHLDPSMVEQR